MMPEACMQQTIVASVGCRCLPFSFTRTDLGASIDVLLETLFVWQPMLVKDIVKRTLHTRHC
jgi:hypothetical protein